MIIVIKEIWDAAYEFYYFDTDKIDGSIEFEKNFYYLCMLAVNRADKTFSVPKLAKQYPKIWDEIQERFSSYQDGTGNWNRLTTKPPCFVDDEITLIYGEL